MKNQIITSFLCFVCSTSPLTTADASVSVEPQEARAVLAEKMRHNPQTSLKANSKAGKRLTRLAKRIERKLLKRGAQVDFDDPVDKWLWFGVFGLGLAILLSLLTSSAGIGGLIALGAIVCLVIWVIKRGEL